MSLSTEDRRKVLEKEVAAHLKRGYIVVSQTDTSAQLLKRKTFSLLWALLWFLCLGVGLIVYVLWYAAKRDQTVYLSVDESGKLSRR